MPATKTSKTNKTSNTTKTSNATAKKPQQFNLVGFDQLEFGDIYYTNIDYVLNNFTYLHEFNKDWYVRKNAKLTKSEIENYELALTVPKSANEFSIRILQPLLVWVTGDKKIIINGNSRIYTTDDVLKRNPEMVIDPIPYQEVRGKLTREIVERLQYDLNDTTRTNDVVEKLQRINGFLQTSLKSGMDETTARLYVSSYFGISVTTISTAKTLFDEKIPNIVREYLNDGIATTEGALKLIQASNALNMSIEDVAGHVIASSKKGKINEGAVKKWRNAKEQELAAAEAAESITEETPEAQETPIEPDSDSVVDEILHELDPVEVNDIEETPETPEAQPTQPEAPITLNLESVENSKENISKLFLICGRYFTNSSKEYDLNSIGDELKKLLSTFDLDNPTKKSIQASLGIND